MNKEHLTAHQSTRNVTVLNNGRIMMSLHQFYAPKYTVVEYKDNVLIPFS